MLYRKMPRVKEELSILGFGCMRLPTNGAQIDEAAVVRMMHTAVDNGINYVDTARPYHGGESEPCVGRALKGLRDKVQLATKLPSWLVKSREDMDSHLNEQLRLLQTDHIDFYLVHNLPTLEFWEMLLDLGIERWLAEKRASGQIRWFGFSFHGAQKDFLALLEAYDWDFCQIQYNYLDVHYQAGQVGLKAARAKGLPVIVMEPLRGGKLASGLPKDVVQLLRGAEPESSLASWAFKWLYDQEEVSVVLSGMNAVEQVQDNLAIAAQAAPGMLSPEQRDLLANAVGLIKKSYRVPCTGCDYCMPCPHGVNIPGCFSAYNARYTQGLITGMSQYVTSTAANHPNQYAGVANCQSCGVCESKCPQQIAISQGLKEVRRHMEPAWFRLGLKIVNRLT